MWFFLVTNTEDKYFPYVSSILDKYVDRLNRLLNVQDKAGRKASEAATPKCRRAMLKSSFLFGRYEIRDGPAEHESETCVVRIARDHENGGQRVALKFFRERVHFERERIVRDECKFDDSYVISALRSHDGDTDFKFGHEVAKKYYNRYCLVMLAADRNLGAVMLHEQIAGRDVDHLRLISKELIEAVAHMHSKSHIHGDVKRKNVY